MVLQSSFRCSSCRYCRYPVGPAASSQMTIRYNLLSIALIVSSIYIFTSKATLGAVAASTQDAAAECPTYLQTDKYRTSNHQDFLNTTVSISPKRPSANVRAGEWISGRATFYGADDRIEASRVACGEPAGQFGVIEHGSCGYTNSDESLPFPREVYAAAADTNEDYPGSCGRCYQVSLCLMLSSEPSGAGNTLLALFDCHQTSQLCSTE